ncbi:hypothetical protein BG015_005614 [Linnemannia schmuckeri]|uniref:Uncharacterized protein n=1 Tax=Linnemannia schmuckeri TaxID=64567 RepID=A0A9P5S3A4_9FUNG|nr:hypothetical protein BG015_005614 [Linnemannia schmuckeri]
MVGPTLTTPATETTPTTTGTDGTEPTDGTRTVTETTGVINTVFDTVASLTPMIPEPIKPLIAPVINTLDGFKGLLNDALKDAGTVASTAASALSQLMAVTDLVAGVDGLIDTALNFLNSIAPTGQDVATCMGAVKAQWIVDYSGIRSQGYFPVDQVTS